jgi:hypothetical protein
MPYSLFPPKKTFDFLYFLSTGNWREKSVWQSLELSPLRLAPPDKKRGGGRRRVVGRSLPFFIIVMMSLSDCFVVSPSFSTAERDESPFRLFFSLSLSLVCYIFPPLVLPMVISLDLFVCLFPSFGCVELSTGCC